MTIAKKYRVEGMYSGSKTDTFSVPLDTFHGPLSNPPDIAKLTEETNNMTAAGNKSSFINRFIVNQLSS